jgi:hypothetical protein
MGPVSDSPAIGGRKNWVYCFRAEDRKIPMHGLSAKISTPSMGLCRVSFRTDADVPAEMEIMRSTKAAIAFYMGSAFDGDDVL